MTPRKSFRPTPLQLEFRQNPAVHVPPPVHIIPPVPYVDFAFAQSGKYPDQLRLAQHARYSAQAKTDSNPVVFLGDSLTFLWGDVDDPTAPGFPYWSSTFRPMNAANFGIVGDHTENLLWRVEDGELAGKPKVVVLMIGINDLIAGRTPQETAANIGAVVHAIRAGSPDTKILLLGLLPNYQQFLNVPHQEVNALISKLGGTPDVTYLDPGALLADQDGVIRAGLVQPDYLHLTGPAYQILSYALVGPVRAALGQ